MRPIHGFAIVLLLGVLGNGLQSEASAPPDSAKHAPYHAPSKRLPPTLRDWRYPTESDFEDDWAEYRPMIPEPFHVRGDFDENGIQDDVWILLRKKGPGYGVFAIMGEKRASRSKVIQIFSTIEDGAQEHGLEAYPTSRALDLPCTPERMPCNEGQMVLGHLPHPAFAFYEFEDVVKLYTWDPGKKTLAVMFERIGLP